MSRSRSVERESGRKMSMTILLWGMDAGVNETPFRERSERGIDGVIMFVRQRVRPPLPKVLPCWLPASL